MHSSFNSFLSHCDKQVSGDFKEIFWQEERVYVLNLLFTSRQLGHIVLLSRGFDIVSPMFKFLCVLYRQAEEVFSSAGQSALSTVVGFSHFSGSVLFNFSNAF